MDCVPLDLHICERDVCNPWTMNQCMQHSIDISFRIIMVLLFFGFLKYFQWVEKIALIMCSAEHGFWPVEFSNW